VASEGSTGAVVTRRDTAFVGGQLPCTNPDGQVSLQVTVPSLEGWPDAVLVGHLLGELPLDSMLPRRPPRRPGPSLNTVTAEGW